MPKPQSPQGPPKLDARDCVLALRELYKPPAYAFFEQVANGTGWRNKGWCDALVMGIWPSRGLDLSGFEIKVSRNDWKKELERPDKAEKIAKYCDYWFVVCPKGLIRTDEVPRTWGLIEVSEKNRAATTVPGTKLAPEPFSREFLAALLRKQSDLWDEAMRTARQEGREDGAKSGAGELAIELAEAKDSADALRKKIDEFEKASGVSIMWRVGDIGKAVKAVLSEDYRQTATEILRSEIAVLARARDELTKELGALEALEAKLDPNPQ
jgi:hypothetical protein